MNDLTTTTTLATTYAMYLLELTKLKGVRESAETLVAAGSDLPTLVDLMNLPDEVSREDVLRLLESVLSDARAEVPNPLEARRIVARHYARQIVAGALSPYEGARKIWWELWTDCRELKELTAFAGLASEYEDDTSETHRAEYERDIVREARALCNDAERGISPITGAEESI